jgi:hypothetical protein
MGEGQIRAKLVDCRVQLNRPQAVAQDLQQLIFSGVAADHLTGKIKKFQKFADLIHVSGSQNQLNIPPFQFFDDRQKKGNVGRVVYINPNLFLGNSPRGGKCNAGHRISFFGYWVR